MEMPRDLTVELLKSIRNEIRSGNERLENLEKGQSALEKGQGIMGRRLVEAELRTATAITELAGTVNDLTRTLRAQFDLRPRVEKCEADIRALKRKSAAG